MSQEYGYTPPNWTCPDCGAEYYGSTSTFRFCPACRDKKMEKEKQYWLDKLGEMRSVVNDILAGILNKEQ